MLHACKGHLKKYEQQHKELRTDNEEKSTKTYKNNNQINIRKKYLERLNI